MFPRFSIGDISLPFFSIGFSIASVIFLILSVKSLKNRGIDFDESSTIVLLILFSVILFSKIPLALFHGLRFWDMFKFWETGHTLFGGLIISTLVVYIYSKVKKIDFVNILAGLSYPALFALAAYRLFVCLPVGCCYGFPYHHGILFTEESFAAKEFGRAVRLFPSQLVEAFLFSIFGLILYEIEWKKLSKSPSVEDKIRYERDYNENIILLFLLFLTIERFVAELIRYDIKEKVIKVDNYGLSVWFFISLFIFSAVSFYFKLLRRYIDEIKGIFYSIFLLIPFVSLISQFSSCSGKNKKNFEYVPEAMKFIYSFSHSVVFISYVFIKVKGSIGSCVKISGEKADINCSFDLRIASGSRSNAVGSCNVRGDKLLDCNVRLYGNRFYSEIYGNVEFYKDYSLYLENITVNILNSDFYSGSIILEKVSSEIVLIEGGSTRNFKIKGESQMEESRIKIDGDLLVRDEGGESLKILPRAFVRIKGCVEIKSSIMSDNFIIFSDTGCAWQGKVEFDGIHFDILNGSFVVDSESYQCEGKNHCPMIYF